eukprot:snap_masked-scaffold_99-processed-gene-0.25-mRNA-1 protein AED:1.00 eAED:1.00 QI:0/-1/0/0/-1/1/1/0/756
MERRRNKTPNELFLFYKLTTPLIQRSPKHFAINISNQIKEPINVEELISNAEQIKMAIDQVQEEVYNSVKLKRDLENSRLNKKRKMIMQFSQGDYVLVSEYGTLNANEKTRLSWLGPYQVTDIISKDVYEVESLLGKRRIVHASRLWFYADEKPTGNENLKALFTRNFQSLEIDKIKKIQLRGNDAPSYYVFLSWLGFDSQHDSWEPLDVIYKDVPLLVRSFTEKMRSTYRKDAILAYLNKLDNHSSEGEPLLRRARAVNYKSTTNFALDERSNTLGWYEEEKEVLVCLVKRFGCGNYEKFQSRPYLPFRSKQQITTQIQSILNLQSISMFHGLHFDLYDAREYLKEEMGITKFHKNLPGKANMFSERDAFIRVFKSRLCSEDLSNTPIPYFRRLNDLRHIKLMISESDDEKCKAFMMNSKVTLDLLKSKLSSHSTLLEEVYSENKSLLDHFYSLVSLNEDFWMVLSDYWCTVINAEEDSYLQLRSGPQFSISEEGFSITLELHDEHISLTLLDLPSSNKLILTYLGGNVFLVSGTTLQVYLKPAFSRIILENIFSLNFPYPTKNTDIFTLVVMDPPWRVGVSNPTRGVSLEYPTLSLEKFSKIKLPLHNFPHGSLLFVWVTNYSYNTVLQWANSLNYYLCDEIIWIKRNLSGKLHKSLGYIFQHSKEICLIFIRKENDKVTYSDTFFEIFSNQFQNAFHSRPENPSVKTEVFYNLLDRSFPHHNKIEFFARTNNVRCRWTSTGLDLTPFFHVNYH